jgi:hypothetical protein
MFAAIALKDQDAQLFASDGVSLRECSFRALQCDLTHLTSPLDFSGKSTQNRAKL